MFFPQWEYMKIKYSNVLMLSQDSPTNYGARMLQSRNKVMLS